MNEQNSFMLMFALGPVQIFIEQARKTRDLWVGSLLLSTLMEAAMQGIEEKLVFPAGCTVGEIPDIPNKYVALFPSAQAAQQAAEQSKKQIKARWDSICQIVRDQIITDYHYGDQTTHAIWQRQTDFEHVFEVYWAIVPQKAEYKAWLERAEQILSARKRLRDFQPQDEPGEKSAISGEREVLHRKQGDGASIQQFWKDMTTWRSPRDIDKEGEEHLDSIDTIKRFATLTKAIDQKQAFPSTSSVATAPFVESLLSIAPGSLEPQMEQRWREALEKWDKVTKSGLRKPQEAMQDIPFLFSLSEQAAHKDRQWLLQLDGDLYFPATFTPRRLKKDYAIFDPEPVASRCKDALRTLLDVATELNVTRPTPYYGILQMDGDHMGKLLSNAWDHDKHKEISQALSSFAHEKALPLIEREYPARLVYAGGDDVLAFAPLGRDVQKNGQPRNILELVNQLQAGYAQTVSSALESLKGEQAPQEVTTSIGIVIAHHLTSLSYALRSAREAEKDAKNRYRRNALVVRLLRRSGEQTQVGCHWHYSGVQDPRGQPIELFTRFYTLFKEDILSPKCAHFLLEEAPALVGLPPEAQASEVKRVLLRQLNLAHKSEDQQKALKQEMIALASHIAALAEAMDAENSAEPRTTELHSLQRRYGLVEVFGWLLVMAFLVRKDRDQE